jgi:WD40 repeat protein
LFLLEVVPDNGLVEVACMQWSDGLFDVAWSETDANIIVSASGDGGLQLWNMSCPQVTDSELSTGTSWYGLSTGNRQYELLTDDKY